MNNINSVSPSFGSIQTQYSKMSLEQKKLSDDFYWELKGNNLYRAMEKYGDVDVYVLPAKRKNEINIRLMDPYSGWYIRSEKDNKVKMIEYTLSSKDSLDKMEEVSDKVVESMGKVIEGKVSRPIANPNSIQKGTTSMAKLRPDKYKRFDEQVEAWSAIGINIKKALQLALPEFIAYYHEDNEDAKF